MPTRPDQSDPAQAAMCAARRQQVGARIRELRLAQDLSQESVALEAGLSRNMLIGIEWGKRSIAYERLWDLALVLGVDVASLFENATHQPQKSAYRGGRYPMGER